MSMEACSAQDILETLRFNGIRCQDHPSRPLQSLREVLFGVRDQGYEVVGIIHYPCGHYHDLVHRPTTRSYYNHVDKL